MGTTVVDPAFGSLPGCSAAVDAFPSRAIRPLPSSDSAVAPSARRLSVYVHPMAWSSLLRMELGLFIRLNVGSEIYHLEAADLSGSAPSSVISCVFDIYT